MNINSAMATIEGVVQDFVRERGTIEHLKRGRVEDTITADLANRLRPHFETDGVTVDCQYNKHLNAAKRLNGQVIHLDVAVHERGNDEHNLVAVELETTNKPMRDDVWKLEGLTQRLGGYGYELGLFLVFGIGKQAGEIIAMEWYAEGRRL
jgi:hypothetical protein